MENYDDKLMKNACSDITHLLQLVPHTQQMILEKAGFSATNNFILINVVTNRHAAKFTFLNYNSTGTVFNSMDVTATGMISFGISYVYRKTQSHEIELYTSECRCINLAKLKELIEITITGLGLRVKWEPRKLAERLVRDDDSRKIC